jgi:hypothetical protein
VMFISLTISILLLYLSLSLLVNIDLLVYIIELVSDFPYDRTLHP